MKDQDWLAKQFEESRTHLRAVAYRLLGSAGEADDAIQESWIRLTRSESASIENFGGWLTTVVARVCLDMLRSRKVRQEHSSSVQSSQRAEASSRGPDTELFLADSIAPALLIVLETLTPPERVAFVLHDLFDLDFTDVAAILGRSEVTTRQLASRARRKVRDPQGNSKQDTGQEIVTAFLTASREGNFEALLKLLDPNIILRADNAAIQTTAANKEKGAPQFQLEMHDRKNIADLFKGRAVGALPALINGLAGATWIGGGKPRVAFTFIVVNGLIAEIGVIMNSEDLGEMEITLMNEVGS